MSNIWEKIGDIVESVVTLDSSSDNVSPKRVAEAEDTLSMQPPGTSVRFADNFSWTRSGKFCIFLRLCENLGMINPCF